MYAIIIHKKYNRTPIICELTDISTNLWGLTANELCILVIDSTKDQQNLILSKDLDGLGFDSQIIQNVIIQNTQTILKINSTIL